MLNKRQKLWGKLILALSVVVTVNFVIPISFGQEQNEAQTVIEKRYQPELVIQTGSTSLVNSVALSKDGKIMASGGGDSAVRLWDVETGRQVRSLVGHTGYILSVAFSPDGKTLASGSFDKTIRLWDVQTGRQINLLEGHADFILSVAFSPDGTALASGSKDNTAILWNLGTGKPTPLEGHKGYVFSIVFSPDSKTLASGSTDKTIKLWDTTTGKPIKSLEGHTDEVLSVAFSSDGKMLASAGKDKVIKLWKLQTGEHQSLVGHTALVYTVAFSPDGKTLASGGGDMAIKLWNLETGQQTKSLTGHASFVKSIAFAKDGETLASGSSDNTIKLWNVRLGEQIKSIEERTKHVLSASFSRDGKMLASVSFDNKIKLWNLETGKQTRSLDYNYKIVKAINAIAFSPDGTTLASGDDIENTIKLWNVETGQQTGLLKGHTSWIHSLAFSPDGTTLASGSEDNTIRLWNVKTERQIKPLEGHEKGVKTLAFSPSSNGKTLVSGSKDGTVRMWDVAAGNYKTLETHTDEVSSVAFSPDGTKLASGSFDKTIKVWDVQSGKPPKPLTGHADKINSVSFSPDGKTLVSGSKDGNIIIWDLETENYKSLKGHAKEVSAVVFSPDKDKNLFVSSSWDATVKIWRKTGDKPVATLISLDKEDWVVITPDSRYDASPNAENLMHFVISDPQTGYEIITLDQLKSKSLTPYLLKEIFEKADSGNDFSVTLYPTIGIKQIASNSSTLDLKLENRGGGIGRVEVYVGGNQIINDARQGKSINPKSAGINLPIEIPADRLNAGVNKIEIVVWNAEGDVRSRRREVYLEKSGIQIAMRGAEIVNSSGKEKQTYNGHFYAIIAGVSDYAGNTLDLRFAAKDAEDISKALTLGGRRLFCGEQLRNKKPCERVHIRLLSTEQNAPPFSAAAEVPDRKRFTPTKQNFQAVFKEIAERANPEDVVVIYLAGHGTAITSEEAKAESAFPDLYIYPTMEADTLDKFAFGNKDKRDRMTVTSLEMADWINQIKAKKKAIVFDTCASGAVEADLNKVRAGDALQVRALERMGERTGFYVLMGSAADAVSYEASSFRQGLLTYSLLEAMTGAKLYDGQYVDVEEWFKYAQEKVEDLARGIGVKQSPRSFKAESTQSFYVGRIDIKEDQIPLARPVPMILEPSLSNTAERFDTLSLEDTLILKLLERSKSSNHDEQGAINFVAARRAKGGIIPSGDYTVSGEDVTVNLVLLLDGKPIGKLEVKGTKNDIADKLFNAIIRETHSRIDK
jgi:WD40 repeat protein/uncharacterized caspase-like protein